MKKRFLAGMLVLAVGCGGEDAASTPPEEDPAALLEAARAAEERREAERQAAFRSALDAALALVHEGDLEGASRAADEAGLLPGADREQVKTLRASIQAEVDRLKRREDDDAVRRLLRAKVESTDPAERAQAFEETAAAIREYLATYPDAKNAEEIEAGASFAEQEARKHRDYVEGVLAAQAALDEKRWDDAIDAADRAYRALPFEEARSLRQSAVRKAAPEGMVLVPAGPFPMGRGKHQTVVAPFYIDRLEVSCRQYADFVKATGHPAPEGWNGAAPPKGKEDHPVTRVTGDDATTYAKWAGKRLPTEIEWEKAARGPQGRVFPWGDEWDDRAGNFHNKGTAPVGETPADFSYYGLNDMGGNVAEFTVPVTPFPEPALPEAPERRPKWAVKGGHWASGAIPEDNALYLRFPFRPADLDTGTGFRCAKDAR